MSNISEFFILLSLPFVRSFVVAPSRSVDRRSPKDHWWGRILLRRPPGTHRHTRASPSGTPASILRRVAGAPGAAVPFRPPRCAQSTARRWRAGSDEPLRVPLAKSNGGAPGCTLPRVFSARTTQFANPVEFAPHARFLVAHTASLSSPLLRLFTKRYVPFPLTQNPS